MTVKRSQLLETFGDGVLSKLVVNLGVGGEIELTDDDPIPTDGAIVTFHADAEASALKFSRDGRGQLILTIDRSSFVIDAIREPEPEPETAPMIGDHGEILTAGDAVDAALGAAVPNGDGPAPGDGFDALEGGGETPAKPKRTRKTKAADDAPKSCPWPACRLDEGHDGDHDLPVEDVNE